jgi:hypothetical protein
MFLKNGNLLNYPQFLPKKHDPKKLVVLFTKY